MELRGSIWSGCGNSAFVPKDSTLRQKYFQTRSLRKIYANIDP